MIEQSKVGLLIFQSLIKNPEIESQKQVKDSQCHTVQSNVTYRCASLSLTTASHDMVGEMTC